MKLSRLAGTGLASLTLAVLAPAANATATWSFEDSKTPDCIACAAGTPTLTASAWSNTRSGDRFRETTLNHYSGGLGVYNGRSGEGGSPEHSMDNRNGVDLIALTFSSAVTLTSLELGWIYNDSDLSVLAYQGSGTPPSLNYQTASDLVTTGGWTLVGNYANVGYGNFDLGNTGSGAVSSSWWLVSAYSSSFGGNWVDSRSDYVKLLTVAGVQPSNNNDVPEPGSLALALMALAGTWTATRRTRKPAR